MTDGKSNEKLDEIVDDSRRSFMKKGALASGALALGVAGGGTAAAEGSVTQPQQALTFAYDFNPGMPFRVTASLQQDVVRAILGRQIQGNQIVSDPADWNAYVINYRPGGGGAGEYAFVFTRGGSLQQNQTYRFSTDASFFAARANLLEASIRTGGGGN